MKTAIFAHYDFCNKLGGMDKFSENEAASPLSLGDEEYLIFLLFCIQSQCI